MPKSIVRPMRWLSMIQAYVLLYGIREQDVTHKDTKVSFVLLKTLYEHYQSLHSNDWAVTRSQIEAVKIPCTLPPAQVPTCILSTSRKVAIWKAFSQISSSHSSSTLKNMSSPLSVWTLKTCLLLSRRSLSWDKTGRVSSWSGTEWWADTTSSCPSEDRVQTAPPRALWFLFSIPTTLKLS